MTRQRADVIQLVPFAQLDLQDPFFDSLRQAYGGKDFDDWMRRKAANEEESYASFEDDGHISSMLYLKHENGIDDSTSPRLTRPRLKIGTFKVDFGHHTSIGNRLLAIALREFATGDYEYAYVTMFDTPNTQGLKDRLRKYGFESIGTKGKEELWAKRTPTGSEHDPYRMFPYLQVDTGRDYLLAIMPKYHIRMFGEATLQSEWGIPVDDMKSINTIEKIYLSGAPRTMTLKPGDHIIPYRSSDKPGLAKYRSVVSGVCTVTETKRLSDFRDEDSFTTYIRRRSVFTDSELHNFWNNQKYPYIVAFLYNIPFKRYPNREKLLVNHVVSESARLVCEPISKESFKLLLELGEANEGYVVD
jgi:predicted RNA-binding protein with PUA-like domain